MVLAVDEFLMDAASLRGPFFSLHGHSNSGNWMEAPSWSMFEFRSISCPKSTSFWAWGTQSTFSSDGFCSVRGGLVFCFLCKPHNHNHRWEQRGAILLNLLSDWISRVGATSGWPGDRGFPLSTLWLSWQRIQLLLLPWEMQAVTNPTVRRRGMPPQCQIFLFWFIF